MTEDQLEQQCLEWFAEDGWKIAHGPDLAPDDPLPERVDYRQVLLLADLEAAVRRIVNAGLKLTHLSAISPI
jgi:type I restriction enzyme R subunit